MKLSEAILLGSVLAPQGFGMLQNDRGHLCALGAAARAIGSNCTATLEAISLWPWINCEVRSVRCPACVRIAVTIGENIVHLNDEHKWTFERIARWVASVEPQEEYTDGGPGPGVAALEVQEV